MAKWLNVDHFKLNFMNKVIVLMAVAICSFSIVYGQDKILNTSPAYDNVQYEKQRKGDMKTPTYKQVASTPDQSEAKANRALKTSRSGPVKRMNKYATPSTFKPEPIKAQPLMERSVSPAQPVQQVK